MLQIKNVTKNYGKTEILKGVNLDVLKGQITALIGVNGAGKSTLIEIICGVKKMTNGDILLDGISIKDKRNLNKYKQNLGYMPQLFCLHGDLTVKDNIEYFCAIYGQSAEKIEEIIKLCNLTNYKQTLSKNLSGGYKQLLSLACCIVHNPKLLILDEPTSAMDPIFRELFWNIVFKLKEKGTTILVVTHFLEELLRCDKFACLSSGRIVYFGEVKDFKKDGFIDIKGILKKYE